MQSRRRREATDGIASAALARAAQLRTRTECIRHFLRLHALWMITLIASDSFSRSFAPRSRAITQRLFRTAHAAPNRCSSIFVCIRFRIRFIVVAGNHVGLNCI